MNESFPPLELNVNRTSIWADRRVESHVIRYQAENIRPQPTGVHAKLSIGLDGVGLEYHTCNVEKRDERITLANAASKMFPKAFPRDKYPGTFIQKDLGDFCDKLWETWLGTLTPELTFGESERKALPFILWPYIIKDGGTILFAPPGVGKSYLCLTIAVMVHHGLNTLWETSQILPFYVNLERSKRSMEKRLGDVNAALGLPREEPIFMLHARGKKLSDISYQIEKAIHDNNVGLIVIDSLSRAGMGSMVDDRVMNNIIDAVNALCPTWLLIAHTPRNDPTHTFGSVMADAGADIVVRTVSQAIGSSKLGVGLQVVKANDIAPQKMNVFALEFDKLGLTDIRHAKPGEFPVVESKQKTDLPSAILDYLLEVGTASATDIAVAISGNRGDISSTLKHDERFIFIKKDGRSALYGLRSFESQ